MSLVESKKIKPFLKLAKLYGYEIKERPYELNIWGVRTDNTTPNSFDDKLFAFWKNDQGIWEGKSYNNTTDPGTYWLLNPMNPKGSAILKAGQYKNSHAIGTHYTYTALVQVKPVTVWRDYDRNAILDFNNGKEDTGYHGINIHRAHATGTTKTIDKNSAGCQVFEDADDFADFMKLAQKSKALYGNQFSYTLVDERAYARQLKRYGAYIIGGVIVATAIYIAYRTYKNKPLIPKL